MALRGRRRPREAGHRRALHLGSGLAFAREAHHRSRRRSQQRRRARRDRRRGRRERGEGRAGAGRSSRHRRRRAEPGRGRCAARHADLHPRRVQVVVANKGEPPPGSRARLPPTTRYATRSAQSASSTSGAASRRRAFTPQASKLRRAPGQAGRAGLCGSTLRFPPSPGSRARVPSRWLATAPMAWAVQQENNAIAENRIDLSQRSRHQGFRPSGARTTRCRAGDPASHKDGAADIRTLTTSSAPCPTASPTSVSSANLPLDRQRGRRSGVHRPHRRTRVKDLHGLIGAGMPPGTLCEKEFPDQEDLVEKARSGGSSCRRSTGSMRNATATPSVLS